MKSNMRDTTEVLLANAGVIGMSISDCNEILTLISLLLAIFYTIYKFIKHKKN